jgi:hypothetical protein
MNARLIVEESSRFGGRLIAVTFCLFGTCLTPRALSDEAPSPSPTAPAIDSLPTSVQQQRDELLQWLDDDVYGNVLYRPEEVEAMEEHILKLAPTSLSAFVRETAHLRNSMKSADWKTANKFFQYYRTLDPVLTKSQQYQLAAGASTLAPRDVERLMRSLIDQRARLLVSSQVSQAQNQTLAATRSNFIADQDRMRRYALERAATSSRNYFPAHQAAVASRRAQYQVPPPLITSRQMAQYMVLRGLFGRRW